MKITKNVQKSLFLASLIVGGLIQADLSGEISVQVNSNSPLQDTSVQIQADGTKLIREKDGSLIEEHSNGSKLITKPDGTKVRVKPDGSKVIQDKDGSIIEINTDGSKLITNPDGSSVQIKSDGSKVKNNSYL